MEFYVTLYALSVLISGFLIGYCMSQKIADEDIKMALLIACLAPGLNIAIGAIGFAYFYFTTPPNE